MIVKIFLTSVVFLAVSIMLYKVAVDKNKGLHDEIVKFAGYMLNAAGWIFIASLLAVIWVD